MHQPTIGKAGVLRIQASELLQGFGLLWQTDQVPGIAQPQLRLRGPFHGLGQQGGHLGRCRVGQAQRQDQGARGRGVCRAALACGFYRQRQLPGFAPHAAHGGPSGGRGAALFQGRSQGFFNRVSGGFFVLHPGKHPGHRRNGRILFSRWKLPDRHAQGLASLVHPVQSQQNLQDVAVGFGVFGNSAFPRLRRLQSRLARARLQSQVNGTLEQSWITGFASRVQNDRETTARRAAAHIQLAHQQLVKQRRIEHRLWWWDFVFCGGRGGLSWRGRLRPCAPDARGDEGESKPEFHVFIIIQPPAGMCHAAQALFCTRAHARTPRS